MARIDAQFIAEGEDLFHNALDQLLVIAAGKVRPSDGTGKQGVPGEDRSRCMKADASSGMARGVDYRKGEFPQEMFWPSNRSPSEGKPKAPASRGCIHTGALVISFNSPAPPT